MKRARSSVPKTDVSYLRSIKVRATELLNLGNDVENVRIMLSAEFDKEFIEKYEHVLQRGVFKKAAKKQKRKEVAKHPCWRSSSAENLDEELVEFSTWILPSQPEVDVRAKTITRFETALATLKVPQAKFHVVGSFSQDLWIPLAQSDLDFVILGLGADALRKVALLLKSQKLASKIELITKARVPLVQYVDSATGICVDISFDLFGGVLTSRFLRQLLQHEAFSQLSLLIRVVKYWLIGCMMNDPFLGGLGSYGVTCLAICHIQHNYREGMSVAELVKSFFHFFSVLFNSDVVGISLLNGGSFFKKADRGFAFQDSALAVEDPVDITNNITRAARNFPTIKILMNKAYNILVAQERNGLSKILEGN